MVTGFAHHAVVKCVVRADLIKTENNLQITPFSFVVSVTINVSNYLIFLICSNNIL